MVSTLLQRLSLVDFVRPSTSGQFYCKASATSYDLRRCELNEKSGHERSLTQIKFNTEGDLLFSCSKDHVINVWFSHNGERLGTYDGHNGTVWTIDVDCESKTPLRPPSSRGGTHMN